MFALALDRHVEKVGCEFRGRRGEKVAPLLPRNVAPSGGYMNFNISAISVYANICSLDKWQQDLKLGFA